MFKAIGAIGRSLKGVRAQPQPQISVPVLKLINYNENKEDNHKEDTNHESKTGNVLGKGAIVALMFMLGQAMDDTLANMFSWGNSFNKNKIKNRAFSTQVPANNPIEDRFAFQDLTSVDGFVASVFDGHGGWQLSDYASKSLHSFLDLNFKALGNKNPTDEEVVAAINKAFDEEQAFREVSLQAYDLGFTGLAKTGSCALVTVVINNKLYVANSGDCRGLLFRQEGSEITAIKLNHRLNACSKKEQERLKKQFPDEDIFVCKNNNPDACYVKGRLMPTRAFGDFYLKHKEFNNPKNLPKEMGYRTIDKFNGPYITHRPEIKIFTLTKEDKGFLLSSDGLYDELSISQVLKLYNENKDQHPLKIVNTLVGSALTHAADQHEMTVDSLKSLPPGKNKRNIHDDLTLVYINLSSQVG